MNPFKMVKALKQAGVVGINARNAAYILPLNPRKLYPLVDDKCKTKEIAIAAGIAVPELYARIEYQWQAKKFREITGRHNRFVVKPANGSQGDGITVIIGREPDGWVRADNKLITDHEMAYYISNILSGMYSLGGQPDVAMVEYCVDFDPVFDHITYKGVPDIRVIVYKGVPAMGMLRIPTRESEGKANLHKGGIGLGIDMKTGLTTTGVQHDKVISRHPDTGNPLSSVAIPHWDTILELSARSCDITGLGYLGVDIVLDKTLGPLILELNARPGLAIQTANQTGLARRYDDIEGALAGLDTLDRRLNFVKQRMKTVYTD